MFRANKIINKFCRCIECWYKECSFYMNIHTCMSHIFITAYADRLLRKTQISLRFCKLNHGLRCPVSALFDDVVHVNEQCMRKMSSAISGCIMTSFYVTYLIYKEPWVQRQHLFPDMLALKWICCSKEFLMRPMIRKAFIGFIYI